MGNETVASGNIMIVDDDPVVAGMLGASLAAAGYRIVEANSGEEALGRLAGLGATADGALPDMLFLDIEMGMGIDGFETCRRLRATAATHKLPVIFLSGHDELDDRLRAYDAGGNDFLAKPFVPDEVLRKASLAITHKRQQESAELAGRSSSDEARVAFTRLGDSEVMQKFSRGAHACRSLRALAQLTINSMAAFDIDCHVQLRTPAETLTLTPQGAGSPLEESVIEKLRTMDRIFIFKNRLIINYERVSLLVPNMPIGDEDLCGRIRDQAASIGETAELALGNIQLRIEALQRAAELAQLAADSRQGVEELRGSYREMQVSTRIELETMAKTIEGMYVHLGLTERQEFNISNTVRNAVDLVLVMFERGGELDRNFAGILEGLTRAGAYRVAEEDELAPDIELF